MRKLIEEFPKQLEEAISIAQKATLTKSENTIHHVVVCGLGGSGIGGSIAADLYGLESDAPINVYKGYALPKFVSKNTLLLACSYSGNTEETLSTFQLAIQQKAKISCITSGGKLEKLAQEHGLDLIKIPSGNPPRSSLGYSLVQILKTLHFHGIIKQDVLDLVNKAGQFIKKNQPIIVEEANKIAASFLNKFPIIYACDGTEGIAIRFRQQINENSKELCLHHVIPEMNHNELVGWTKENKNLVVLFIHNITDHPKNKQRIDINEQIIKKYAGEIIHLHAKGTNKIESAVYLIHLLDWVSLLIAEKKQIDPVEVKVIDFLKAELVK